MLEPSSDYSRSLVLEVAMATLDKYSESWTLFDHSAYFRSDVKSKKVYPNLNNNSRRWPLNINGWARTVGFTDYNL